MPSNRAAAPVKSGRGDINGKVDYWTPTRADIIKAESLAAKYIRDTPQLEHADYANTPASS